MEKIPLFHLAFPVRDLKEAHTFYTRILGCETGRSSDSWIDFNFYGHQVVAHLQPNETKQAATNMVDGDEVPVRHFGVILDWHEWHSLADRLEKCGISFIVKPHIRFKGQLGEQATMFFLDPSGNALEFKSFKDESQVFAK